MDLDNLDAFPLPFYNKKQYNSEILLLGNYEYLYVEIEGQDCSGTLSEYILRELSVYFDQPKTDTQLSNLAE